MVAGATYCRLSSTSSRFDGNDAILVMDKVLPSRGKRVDTISIVAVAGRWKAALPVCIHCKPVPRLAVKLGFHYLLLKNRSNVRGYRRAQACRPIRRSRGPAQYVLGIERPRLKQPQGGAPLPDHAALQTCIVMAPITRKLKILLNVTLPAA